MYEIAAIGEFTILVYWPLPTYWCIFSVTPTKLSTKYSAERVLKIMLEIETELGRVRVEKWGERLIDIDIIFFNDEIIETSDLCIPHKHMHERNFVLEPLNEIASAFIHPKYNKTVSELLKDSKDTERVEAYAI